MTESDDKFRPTRATAEGQYIHFAESLSNPGNPRRAGKMLLVLAAFVAGAVLVVVLMSLTS